MPFIKQNWQMKIAKNEKEQKTQRRLKKITKRLQRSKKLTMIS